MSGQYCEASETALLLVDPYNDFLSEGGKIWPSIKAVANPTQQIVMKRHSFARGEWGGEWHPDLAPQEGDIIVREHWAQSGFANTDLDFQLKQHGIRCVIIVGLLANTCIESTARYAMELGYYVTLERDATAALNFDMMHAAHHLNGPTFAHEILTTEEVNRGYQKRERAIELFFSFRLRSRAIAQLHSKRDVHVQS